MTPRLEVRGLTRRFGPLVANDDVSIAVEPGELHCLLGENGAGKSTLSACIYGLLQPDTGGIFIDGVRVDLRTPADAIRAGVGMVHQHFVLVSSFTALENIAVGTGTGVLLDLARTRRRVEQICTGLDLDLDLDRPVERLSVGQRQWVEIVKALYLGARLLILDEPTAVLTPQESLRLFTVIHGLKQDGISILLITHKMREVMRSDRVSVLRKGKLVATVETARTTAEELTRMMIGRPVERAIVPDESAGGVATLSVRDLVLSEGLFRSSAPINFDLRAGEILGIAGVAGNGQDELLETIAGLRPPRSGEIILLGHSVRGLGADEIASRGAGYVPSDRFRDGLVPDFSIAENLILGQQWRAPWRNGPFLDGARIHQHGKEAIGRYAIAAPGPQARSAHLSGGNAQKVIIAREFAKARHLLLCNQPTRGIDVGATEFIHRELLAKRTEGCAVLLVSEELDDLFALSDRIAVMFAGEIMGVVVRTRFDIDVIGRLMAGLRLEEAA
jgi:simple sugar transport system ATP-binding protein